MTRNNRDKFEFFPEPFPNEEPEEIKPEQIFVDGSRPSLIFGEAHPLKSYSDILEKERDYRQEVSGYNVSGRGFNFHKIPDMV